MQPRHFLCFQEEDEKAAAERRKRRRRRKRRKRKRRRIEINTRGYLIEIGVIFILCGPGGMLCALMAGYCLGKLPDRDIVSVSYLIEIGVIFILYGPGGMLCALMAGYCLGKLLIPESFTDS